MLTYANAVFPGIVTRLRFDSFLPSIVRTQHWGQQGERQIVARTETGGSVVAGRNILVLITVFDEQFQSRKEMSDLFDEFDAQFKGMLGQLEIEAAGETYEYENVAFDRLDRPNAIIPAQGSFAAGVKFVARDVLFLFRQLSP